MNDLVNLLIVLLIFFLVIAVAWLLAAKAGLLKRTFSSNEEQSDERAPYKLRSEVLSAGERHFLCSLQQAVVLLCRTASDETPPLLLLIKIRLSDVLEVDRATLAGSRSKSTAANNRIHNKHIDFVLCHPQTSRALVAIELDDRSHERAERRERDVFVDRACAAAGLPIAHIKAASAYKAETIAGVLATALNRPARSLNAHVPKSG